MEHIKNNMKYLGITLLLFLLHIFIPSYLISIFKKMNFIYLNNNTVFTIIYIIVELLELTLFSLIFKKELIKATEKNFKKDIIYHLKFWLIGLILMILFNMIINMFLFTGSNASNEILNRKLLIKYPVYTIFSVLIYAPFCEELIFRCSLKKGFKYCITFALVSGLLFGGIHVLSTVINAKNSLDFINQLLYIFPYGALGFCFAYAYFKTDNIIADILSHFVHNLFVLMLLMIF